MNDDLNGKPENISLERWKVLCDLDLRSWAALYHDLPDQVKDKGYRMITLYTASLATIPSLSSNAFGVIKTYVNLGQTFGAICLSILLLATIVSLAMAIYHIVNVTLKTREFHLFTPSAIRTHVENEEYDEVMIYKIVTKHLEKITKHNHDTYEQMLHDMDKSLKLFFLAVVVGFVLFFTVLIQQQFFSA